MRFFLIDRITAWEPGETAQAIKTVALSEDFFDDHFPLRPVMPGVLILEGMAQIAGLLLEEGMRRQHGRNVKALLSIIKDAQFRRPAYPGDRLEYRATVISSNELGGKVEVQGTIDGDLAADGLLLFSFHELSNARQEARRAELLNLWLRGLETGTK